MFSQSDSPAEFDLSIRWIIYASCAFVLVILLGTTAIGKVKFSHILTGKHHLELQLARTEQALEFWITSELSTLERFAQQPRFIELAEAQRLRYQQGLTLSGPVLNAMRELFDKQEGVLGYNGFFVILPNGISIASMRDSNIGTRNIINIYRAKLFAKAANGASVFIPPIPSDVHIAGQKLIAGKQEQASAFFLTPIRDHEGEIIALLSRRVNPDKDFSQLLNPASSHFLYNIFAFDRYGHLISTPNNIDSLISHGFLRLNETPTLGVRLTAYRDFDEPDEYAERNDILPLNSAIKKLMDNPGNATLMSPTPYRDLTGTQVYGAWRWSDDLGFGIAIEQNQDSVLTNFAATCTILVGLTSALCLFIVYITYSALRSQQALNLRHISNTQQNAEENQSKIEHLTTHIQQQDKQLEKEHDHWACIEKSVAIAFIDEKGNVLQSSSAFRQLTALTEKSLNAHEFNLLEKADLSQYNKEEINEALTRRMSWHGEITMKLFQGQTLYLRTTITPLRTREQGQPRFLATLLDFTSPRGYAASLKYRLDQLNRALEPADIGFWRLNIPLGRLLWDDKMFALFRTAEQGHIESLNYWWQLIATSDRERVIKTLEQAIEQKSPFSLSFQTEGLIDDGCMAIAGSIDCDHNGEATEVIGLAFRTAHAVKSN